MNKAICIECNKESAKSGIKYCEACLNATKICRICQQRKNIFEFEKNQRTIAGRVSRRGDCKSCRAHKKPLSKKIRDEYESHNPRPAVGEKFTCPVCEKTMTRQFTNDVVLDHSYKTGKIRGWLCRQCNSSIGMMDDSITVLQRAIRWLKGTLRPLLSM